MTNRLSRDTEDAAKVLSALRDKFHPRETLPARLSASEDLRAKLVNVTAGVRHWSVKPLAEDTVLTLAGVGAVRVRTDSDTGCILVSADEGRTFQAPALEYDPVNREWVGRETDPDIVVVPGERIPRKAALLALTEQIVRLLDRAAAPE